MINGKEIKVKTPEQVGLDEEEDMTASRSNNILHTIDMDYAAFYGNHYLSSNLSDNESDEDEEQRTFSSHPFLIT